MHAMAAGMLIGAQRGHLYGAPAQVGLCTLALYPVDPEAVLLAKSLQAVKG